MMPVRKTKQWVEAILYGTGNQRRFTHDSPVMLDVWAQFFEQPKAALEILIMPWLETSPVDVAEALRGGMPKRLSEDSRISYNRRVVAARLSLACILHYVLPLSGWYIDIRKAEPPPSGPVEGGQAPADAPDGDIGTAPIPPAVPMPTALELWEDVDCANMTAAVAQLRGSSGGACSYKYPRLLSFIRMAGLIFDMQTREDGATDDSLFRLLEAMCGEESAPFKEARLELTRRILNGWSRMSLPQPMAEPLIHSITRNRPARLAIAQSVRTVKGDAASSLFSINCSALTWVVMDCGIDATHSAFTRNPEKPVETAQPPGPDGRKPKPTVSELLARSRVKETYDFAYLRELLLNNEDEIPEHLRRAVDAHGRPIANDGMTDSKRRELRRRISQARSVDWDLLRPFLRVEHSDAYPKPIETHGTHVAGILAAKWKENEQDSTWLSGMCPDINLIDIRVCREDGSSDEFVIMSALQFIRHLNASSDRMAIHGVNMSLSLDHDAAVYACGRTPVCEEAERTVANGVVVIAAAGNLGYRRVLGDGDLPFDQFCPVSITDPGNAENVITVGSTHRLEPHNYGVSYFSSRGPTGDGRIKPDLVAPGEKIYAPALGGGAVRLDGTSMAAPHVSGAAAMLMARHVELVGEPQRIKKILCSTATDLGREPYFQGRGLVDVLRAIQSV
ncbi:MAG TPA: S8 family peptidase [Allosphingosinicella sp.]|jgi:hypothetical protein